MKRRVLLAAALVFLVGITASAQQHTSNWVYRNATDTTVVPCWTDSMTAVGFPPSSMSMMMPTQMFMRIDQMPMDSLMIAHDSTFMGWYRMEAGSDSMNFTMMNAGGMGGGSMMMQFMKSLVCRFHWDSLMADSIRRGWHITGMKGWNGTSWSSISGLTYSGNTAIFQSSTAYSAVAFVGTASVTDVRKVQSLPAEFKLMQNYPNPFNPTTNIVFALPRTLEVRLDVFNILGQKVASLVNGVEQSGVHEVRFDGAGLPSGIYFYRLQAGNFTQSMRFVLLK